MKCNALITSDNPTGAPPGLNVTEPGMLTLLTRFPSYANIVKKGAQSSSTTSQSDARTVPTVSASKSFFSSFPPGRATYKANKARVKFDGSIKPLVMEGKEKST